MRKSLRPGASALLGLCVAAPVLAQRLPSPTVSIVMGPGLALERWPGQSPLISRDTKNGLTLAGRLTIPFGMDANLVATASRWRGDGSELQTLAVGLEARLGEIHQFTFGVGPALVRQPYQEFVVFYPDGTSPTPEDSTLGTRFGAHIWTGYTWRVGKHWQIGPYAAWSYPFRGQRRFHHLYAGLQIGAVL